ncbi:MAG: hypothetical protein KAU38_07900 [Desulfobacterales bacterium]|nr:hypothetical protein [Desulfobacterales bacterium]
MVLDLEKYLNPFLHEKSYKTLLEAKRFSLDRIDKIKEIVIASDQYKKIKDKNVGWLVTGSIGRLEALKGSDIDLTLICRDEATATSVYNEDQQIRQILREHFNVPVSKGENFTSPFSTETIANVDKIGGLNDNVNLLTKRILLLTEARPVVNDELFHNVQKEVFRAYVKSEITRRRYLIALIYDITRFHRTLGLDYKSRVDFEDKPWGIRYIKLRCSRKYWYFTTMLALLAAITQNETLPEVIELSAQELLNLSPIERIVKSLEIAGIREQIATIPFYNYYLKQIGNPETRKILSEVDHNTRYQCEVFRLLKRNADRLRRAMIETLEALPPNWRRHINWA